MKLTNGLQHVKRFWWGNGWGDKPRKNTDHFYYKMQWNAKRRRPLENIEQTLPEGVAPVDPNFYLKRGLNNEITGEEKPFVVPWPYSNRPIKGTPEDPNYKSQTALVYQRNKRLLDPINLSLNFTNSILENNLPDQIQKYRNNVKIDRDFVEFCKRRVAWCLENDSALRKLPLNREFPYLDQRPPRCHGITVNRKESNLLQTLYELTNTWIAKNMGFNPNVVLQRISYPNCILPINRDNKFTILDLECDFTTLLSPVNSDTEFSIPNFDNNFATNTVNKQLNSIRPLSWELAFNEKNFYKSDYEFAIPNNSFVQSIFLSNNNVRQLSDEDYQGRSIMFCYGYAAQEVKARYQLDDISQICLDKPITIQCVFTSPKAFYIGFALYQLNTLKFDDESIRNQVWLSEPKSILDNTEEVIADLVTIQSRGMFNHQ